MNQSEYDLFVESRKKSGDDIVSEFDAEKADLLHMAVGVSKESGELLDAIARVCFYNKPLDLDNVVEELGDLEFFLSGLRLRLSSMMGETSPQQLREDTLIRNEHKLTKRYASGRFSNTEANARADKENENV